MSSPELRASDADRDRTIADLREHTAVGRLTLELRVRMLSLFGTPDLWRVPPTWSGRTFDEVIDGLRRGEERELAPPGRRQVTDCY